MSDKQEKPSVLKVIASTLAAFVGIQNDQNRERDFQQKTIVPYLISGAVLASLFIITLVMIAKQLDPGGA